MPSEQKAIAAPAQVPPGDPRALHDRFRATVIAHIDAAYNLAWWMTRSEHDAADTVQEACLRAWRFFPSYRGGDARSWVLSIVRNVIADRRRAARPTASLDDPDAPEPSEGRGPPEPIDAVIRSTDSRALNAAVASLPPPLREIIILRDVEGLSYAQIATVIGAPIGTVMSRLSRARDAARLALAPALGKEQEHGV